MLEIAIIGAGPYGLSIAAHLKSRGIGFRIFGRPMDSWLAHMPRGMMLKSDGFASNLDDPKGAFTLKQFCAERRIEYSDAGIPVRLDTFGEYGLAFRDRMAPELEDKIVAGIDHTADGFVLLLEDGESVKVRRVILAVGTTHFGYVPETLAHLSPEFVSHSSHHHDLESFRGRKVVVIGGGSSAVDLAALLRDADADVELVARQSELKFHTAPQPGKQRPLWQRIRHPQSGLGPGLRSRFYADAPGLFHRLPENLRLKIVRKHLGPSSGWFVKDKVMGRVPLLLGYSVQGAEIQNGRVRLHLRSADAGEREISAEHVIAGTGYKVDVERLAFLAPRIRAKLKTVHGAPILSANFESSVPGMYFAGIAAANSFGPVMRFVFGAAFAAHTLAEAVSRSVERATVSAPARSVASLAE